MLLMEDRDLIARILDGDMQSFKLLIKRHERLVAHMIGRLVWEAPYGVAIKRIESPVNMFLHMQHPFAFDRAVHR